MSRVRSAAKVAVSENMVCYRSDGKQWYQGVKSVIKIGIAFREKNAVVIPCTGGWDDLHKYCMNFCFLFDMLRNSLKNICFNEMLRRKYVNIL